MMIFLSADVLVINSIAMFHVVEKIALSDLSLLSTDRIGPGATRPQCLVAFNWFAGTEVYLQPA